MVNNTHADPELIKEADKPKPVNKHLVGMLQQLLADAEKGAIQGLVGVRVTSPGIWGLVQSGEFGQDFYCGAGLIMMSLEQGWMAQLVAQAQHHAKRGLLRATSADMAHLPNGLVPRRN